MFARHDTLKAQAKPHIRRRLMIEIETKAVKIYWSDSR
jgi:hypothetical protein